jgi:DnaJ-class molecular chaperone
MCRFKKLALRHHPLKNPSDMAINLLKFHEICEAYEVLSNRKITSSFYRILALNKTIFDQFGGDILREGVKDSKGSKYLI